MSKIAIRFKKMMFVSMGVCLLDIICGILFFLYDDFSTDIYSVIVGALFVVHGLFYLIRYIYDGFGKKIFGLDIIFAVASLVLGLFSMFNPMKELNIYLLLFGLGICIIGAEMFSYGISFMKKREETYPLITIMSLLVMIMGVLSVINPFENFILTARIMSYFSIATGLLGCLHSNLFRKRTFAILDMYK